jgi:hypothetical protein
MNTQSLQLWILDERIAVCQLSPDASLPAWAIQSLFFSITRTHDELSVVCPEGAVPESVKAVQGWRCFRVVGSMAFSVTGVLASLTTPLAEAKVGIFAISTFDTDYLLVKEQDLDRAIDVLRAFGHVVRSPDLPT